MPGRSSSSDSKRSYSQHFRRILRMNGPDKPQLIRPILSSLDRVLPRALCGYIERISWRAVIHLLQENIIEVIDSHIRTATQVDNREAQQRSPCVDPPDHSRPAGTPSISPPTQHSCSRHGIPRPQLSTVRALVRRTLFSQGRTQDHPERLRCWLGDLFSALVGTSSLWSLSYLL